MGELAISTSVFCYARIMVDMVDAVSDFKMFSEFLSLGGKFKQILVLDHRLVECVCRAGPMALDYCLASLFPSFYASSLSVYLHHPAVIVLRKPSQVLQTHPMHGIQPLLIIFYLS